MVHRRKDRCAPGRRGHDLLWRGLCQPSRRVGWYPQPSRKFRRSRYAQTKFIARIPAAARGRERRVRVGEHAADCCHLQRELAGASGATPRTLSTDDTHGAASTGSLKTTAKRARLEKAQRNRNLAASSSLPRPSRVAARSRAHQAYAGARARPVRWPRGANAGLALTSGCTREGLTLPGGYSASLGTSGRLESGAQKGALEYRSEGTPSAAGCA